jgi:CRP/FNR family cyclic AMP-dependent transcriptional regulator
MPSLGERVEVLARTRIFGGLSRRRLRKLARLCIERTWEPGATLIEEGTTGLGLYLLTAGEVVVFRGQGPARLELARLHAGDLLGEIALVDEQPRSATAVAVLPTRCLLVTRDDFRTLTRRDPEIAWCVVPVLSERIRDLQQRLTALEPEDGAAGTRGDASAPSDETAPPLDEEEAEADDESGDGDRRGAAELAVDLLRLQVGVMLAGARGARSLAGTAEALLLTLDREAGLGRESLDEIVRRAPAALATATREAIADAARLPSRLLDALAELPEED